MTVYKNQYVVVNIWTSKENEAIKGNNCGHVSLSVMDGISESYISLWPAPTALARNKFSNFQERPTSYQQDYEQDCFLEAISEKNYRKIDHIDERVEGETTYKYNKKTHAYTKLTEQPDGFKDEEIIRAVKLIPANFRMVLYSLNVGDVLEEFNRLRKPGHITGWSMVGSNFFTRNINVSGETTENCASLAYRCLDAGGLYSRISSKLSFQPSSITSPDDLLRIVVATKANELDEYDEELDNWKVQGVDESPLQVVINAYNDVGQNANAEEDLIPSFKPSVGGCTLF